MAGDQGGVNPKPNPAGGVPPRPDISPTPGMRTVLAMVLAVMATAMTVPAAVQTFTSPCLPNEPGVTDWAASLWVLAFFVGISSLILAIYRLKGERRRNCRWGQILAGSAVGVASLGGVLWGVGFLCGAIAGL